MNKVILMGRLTKDMTITNTGNTTIARGSIAVDRRYHKDGEPTADFINIISFGKTAEFLEKYGNKGVKFVVEGRIQTGSYTDKEGKKIYTTDVIAESVEFAESKGNNDSNTTDDKGFMNLPDGMDEELPFN